MLKVTSQQRTKLQLSFWVDVTSDAKPSVYVSVRSQCSYLFMFGEWPPATTARCITWQPLVHLEIRLPFLRCSIDTSFYLWFYFLVNWLFLRQLSVVCFLLWLLLKKKPTWADSCENILEFGTMNCWDIRTKAIWMIFIISNKFQYVQYFCMMGYLSHTNTAFPPA